MAFNFQKFNPGDVTDSKRGEKKSETRQCILGEILEEQQRSRERILATLTHLSTEKQVRRTSPEMTDR